MRVCYGILSSSTDGAVVNQLAHALGAAPVFVHHDFAQRPDFALNCGPNVRLLRDPVATQWGKWSQAQAMLLLIETALREAQFDYFQLLSETCLPIRPPAEFAAWLEETCPDACIGLIRMNGRADDLGTLNYAWRYYARGRFWPRVLMRLTRACMEREGVAGVGARPLVQGVSVIRPAPADGAGLRLRRAVLQTLLDHLAGGHPFGRGDDCHVGSTWFCLSRATAEHVLAQLRARPALVEAFRTAHSPDEAVVHTVVGNAGLKLVPLQHFLSWTERESGPDELGERHAALLSASGKFFARKFSKSPGDSLRQAVLARLAVPAERAAA